MRFLVDACVQLEIATALRAQGYDATHVREESLQRLPDPEVFLKAAREERILVTFDLDFGEIISLSGGSEISVIVLRLRNPRLDRVLNRLENAIAQTAGALVAGAIVSVDDDRHRVRKLPIGRR